MVLPSFSPLTLISVIAGPEGAKNLAGNVLRLIQIRITTPSLGKISSACQVNSPKRANRPFHFHKRGQLFIRSHNEPLTVAAMRVTNEDCSPVGIHAWHAAPTPTGCDCPSNMQWQTIDQAKPKINGSNARATTSLAICKAVFPRATP